MIAKLGRLNLTTKVRPGLAELPVTRNDPRRRPARREVDQGCLQAS